MRRAVAHCNRCEAHQGHAFPDKSQPTGLLYFINGLELDFKKRT